MYSSLPGILKEIAYPVSQSLPVYVFAKFIFEF